MASGLRFGATALSVLLMSLCFAALPTAAAAEAHMRVIDAGRDWCVVARTPEGGVFVYESGADNRDCIDAVREFVPERRIDVLVISRGYRNALRAAPPLLAEFEVGQIISNRPELRGMAGVSADRLLIVGDPQLQPGRPFELPGGRIVYLAGWLEGADTRGEGERRLPRILEQRLATIAVNFEYGAQRAYVAGASVSGFTGSMPACGYSERTIVQSAAPAALESDVLVVGLAAFSECFLSATRPRAVVTGNVIPGITGRLLATGLDQSDLFTTVAPDCYQLDTPLDEGYMACRDRDDDDIDIWLPADGPMRLNYRVPRFRN